MPPAYFYHLKFDLEEAPAPNSNSNKSNPFSHEEAEAEAEETKKQQGAIAWLPPPGTDIFDRSGAWTAAGHRDNRDRDRKRGESGVGVQGGDIREREGERKEGTTLPLASRDWRFGRVRIEAVDMPPPGAPPASGMGMVPQPSASAASGRVTKAEFRPIRTGTTDVGWGVVRLYRDGEESPWLASGAREGLPAGKEEGEGDEKDCTTLCIPAVPSYLTPSDFLGFVGEKTRTLVSHFRMVMTGRMNRYLVLMKFRDGKDARKWRREWDGTVFNSMEPETCHVVFIKSITFQTPAQPNASFPELSHDPFTPSAASFSKPFPPPTPSLVELPTCPVCLERMDDTTGLLTIPCQHVFHCDCLQKWRGTGCPVCRHTNPSLATQGNSGVVNPANPSSSASHDLPFGSGGASLCSVCDCADDLWICLICGAVGCGRYKGGHAKDHWKQSAHNFALEIETQHVWDYAGDVWVHRLIRDKGDSKVIELPSSSRSGAGRGSSHNDDDMVPREKLESIGFEYTHLLTSQLESQRVYFEELVNKAASKASAAASAAAEASARADDAAARLKELALEHARLRDDVVAGLEKDLAREKKRGDRSAEVARGFGQSLIEEKKVSEGLMKRVEFVNGSLEGVQKELEKARRENEDLKEENRDLMFAVQAGEKLREMERGAAQEDGGGEGDGEGLVEGEVMGGTVSLPEVVEKRDAKKGKGRGKGKGR